MNFAMISMAIFALVGWIMFVISMQRLRRSLEREDALIHDIDLLRGSIGGFKDVLGDVDALASALIEKQSKISRMKPQDGDVFWPRA